MSNYRSTSNPEDAKALLEPAREAFTFLCELAASNNVALFGLESSQERINALMFHVMQESLNILRHEDETLSIENLGGIGAVRRLVGLQHQVGKLPEHLRPEFEKTLSQKSRTGVGRPARTLRHLKSKKETP